MDTTEEHRPERQVTQGPLENSVELREIEVFSKSSEATDQSLANSALSTTAINGGSKRRHWFSTLNLGVSGYISLISLTVSVIVGIGAGQATNRSNSIGLASYEVSAWALCSDHEASNHFSLFLLIELIVNRRRLRILPSVDKSSKAASTILPLTRGKLGVHHYTRGLMLVVKRNLLRLQYHSPMTNTIQ